MKAIQFFTNGRDPEIVECEKPTPKENEVLVKVVTSAIDTGLKEVVKKGMFAGFIHSLKDPLYLGWHFSGKVESKGDKVIGMQVGNEVFGFLQYAPTQDKGAFAEYIAVPYEECAIKPRGISHQIAAAASVECLTALQAMRDTGKLGGKKRVLIIGAGGGVGSAAVPIAKRLGADVTAVCSTKDVERVKKLGADLVVDRKVQTDFPSGLKDSFDQVFDTPCAYGAYQFLGHLEKNGSYVTTLMNFGFFIGYLWALFSSKSVEMVEAKSLQEDLNLLGTWLQDGLEIGVDSVFAVKDMKAAVERQNAREKCGRVVIEVEGKWE